MQNHKIFSGLIISLTSIVLISISVAFWLRYSTKHHSPITQNNQNQSTQLSVEEANKILNQDKEEREHYKQIIEKMAQDTDFDPQKATPQEVVQKMEEYDKLREELQ